MTPSLQDLPQNLLSHKEWIRLTTSIGRLRSKELQAVDDCLKLCEQAAAGTDVLRRSSARWRLEGALRAWKESCGPGDAWKSSIRNKNLAVEQLTAQLFGGDTNAAWGRMPDFMHANFEHARLGVLYLLGHLDMRPDIFNVLLEGGIGCAGAVMSYQGGKVDDGGLGKAAVSTGQDIFNSVMVPGSVILSSAASAGAAANPGAAQGMGPRVQAFFADLAKKALEMIKEKFGGIEPTAAAVKNLVNLCCKLFWSTLGYGLVSGGMDTFKGLVGMADAIITRIRTYMAGKGVAIADGHPHAVLQSIKIAMNLSIMQGLWQTLKGAGNIGLAFATWGVSMIVGLVTSLTEMVVKVLWRIVETIKMKKVCAAANEYWRARGGPNALHTRPFAFHNWFRESVLLLPALAVLTLNSGICGDKMVWLSMFSNGAQISTAEFQKGSEYVDSLKPWGTDYLESCGFSFFSSEPLVAKVVNLTHEARMSGAEKVWSTVVKVAKA